MRKLTTAEFIIKARLVHGNKFDYSEVVFTGYKNKIKIICREHGPFYQRAGNHLTKKWGCNLCSPTGGALLTQQQYIDKCIKKWGSRYDYSEVIFTGVKNKVKIICKEHGSFDQIAEKHFYYGCSDCAGNKKSTTDEFIKKAKIVHGDNTYDYSEVFYISRHKKVKIICPLHKPWFQSPTNHLMGKGCAYCSFNNFSKKEKMWLDGLNIPDTSDNRNVPLTINGKKYNVDGYLPEAKIIYEFLGDYWHGNPATFDLEGYNRNTDTTFQVLFDKTINKIRELRKAGFKVITIWESKYDKNISRCRKSIKGS